MLFAGFVAVVSVVGTGYGFGVPNRGRSEWLWLIQHRMTAKLQ
jgi:hypothetical protein